MEWLINLGYVGLFLGCAMAGSLIPVSSDIFMIGILLAGGDPWLCLLIGSVGYWLGTMTSYGLGWMGKWKWLARFRITRETLEKQKSNIDKYGLWLAVFPWFPVIGRLGSIALGFYKIRPKTVALLMLLGCVLRFLVWVLLYLAFFDQIVDLF